MDGDKIGGNGDKPKIEKQFLTIEYSSDGTIDMKGTIINQEMLAIWLLDKAKDMVKANTMRRIAQAQSKIVKPGGIMNFVRSKHGRK